MDETILQKIIAEEKEYGVDYEKIQQKYLFAFGNENGGEMEVEEHQPNDKVQRTVTNEFTSSNNSSNDKLESSYISQRFITPSQHHGISQQDELRLRNLAAELIIEAGFSLKLPWYTVITAQSLFHRFFYRVSFLDHDIKDSIMACIFLATKVEESPRKLRDIVTVFHHILKVRDGRQDPIIVLNPSSEYYHYLKQLVIENERYVLKELGFELYRLTEHPHLYLLDYLKRLKSSKEVAKKAWNYLNDSYRGTLCVHYPPHIIATSCLYLAIRTTNTPMPKTIWWAIFDTSIKHIFEVCAEILFLYNQPKTEMKDAKEILDAFYKSNNLQKEFYIDNSELFELEKKAKRESEKRDEPKEVREYPRRREGRRSPRYSRDRNGYRGRRDSRDRRDKRERSPRRSRRRTPSRERTRSRDKGRRKYSRSPSSDRDGKSRRKEKARSKDKHDLSAERSPLEKKKRSPSEHKKKKKRDKSKEKKRDKEKDREKERDRDREEKSHKHKKEEREKDKHRDRDDKKKDRDREKSKKSQERHKNPDRDEPLPKEERPKMERKRTLDNAFEEIGQVKRDAEKLQKQKTMEEEGHKKSSSKVVEKKPSEPLNDSLQALKQELLSKIKSNISTSHQSSDLQKGSGEKGKEDKNKIVEEKPEDKGQENDSDDSDEDDEKLLELKKKIMENKKKGAVKK